MLRYFEHVFPLPGHYRLAYWKDGEPNYRRFFDISTLIGRPGRGSGDLRGDARGAAPAWWPRA